MKRAMQTHSAIKPMQQSNHLQQTLFNLLQNDLNSMQQCMQQHLNTNIDLVNTIVQYIVNAGGKRLRPMLLLLMAKSLNTHQSLNHDTLYTMACVIELIHTATLLHDDVVDESTLRRGLATANAAFGNASSVLVGDFLYSRAFQMMVAVSQDLSLMQVIADATNVIAEGEVEQLCHLKNLDLSQETYLHIIYAKTAKLFEAACQIATLLTKQTIYTQQAMHFGVYLGSAFQIMDDYLDYLGEADTMGKQVADDLNEGKVTLPIIYFKQEVEADPVWQAILQKAILEQNTNAIEQVLIGIKQSDALNKTLAAAHLEAEKAKAQLNLNHWPQNQYTQALLDLCDLAVNRNA
jgi:octaprenyl-diphosphate synthase